MGTRARHFISIYVLISNIVQDRSDAWYALQSSLHKDTLTNSGLGLTKISWYASRPSVVSQGYTAVLPDARGRGIGRRLKAEMLKKLIRDMPEVEYVKTGIEGSSVET